MDYDMDCTTNDTCEAKLNMFKRTFLVAYRRALLPWLKLVRDLDINKRSRRFPTCYTTVLAYERYIEKAQRYVDRETVVRKWQEEVKKNSDYCLDDLFNFLRCYSPFDCVKHDRHWIEELKNVFFELEYQK